MSCVVCRLPFVPEPKQSTSPLPVHFPPQGILTNHQYAYFVSGIGLGLKVVGLIYKLTYFSNNMFGGFSGIGPVVSIVWEHEGSTFFMMHATCFHILRRIFDCEDSTLPSLIRLCGIEEVIGSPRGGSTAGWLPFVNYAAAGEKVDLGPFWKSTRQGPGSNAFDWKALTESKLGWLINRPDVFPKFPSVVEEKRLPPNNAEINIGKDDALAKLPMDLVEILLPFLSAQSYVMLVSTCRLLRYHALTTYQPHARSLVINLGWAIPTKKEYAQASEDARKMMASEDALEADWYLYLSRVHKSKGLRVRRWIWASCMEVKRVYEERFPNSPLALTPEGKKTEAREMLEKKVGGMYGIFSLVSRGM